MWRTIWVSMLSVAWLSLAGASGGCVKNDSPLSASAPPSDRQLPLRMVAARPPVAPGGSSGGRDTTTVISLAAPVGAGDVSPALVGAESTSEPRPGGWSDHLRRFFISLRELELGSRRDHVRIAWLGDSHTQADHWTGEVRQLLQDRFGNGGPGFVHVGWQKGYRHNGLELAVHGPWDTQPKELVSFVRYRDGVLGLGGVRVVPRHERCSAVVRADPFSLIGRGRWDLAVRLRSRDAWVKVTPSGGVTKQLSADPEEPAVIHHLTLNTRGPGGEINVRASAGDVELMGVVVESLDETGVVLDTLGLMSARIRQALAWDGEAWIGELRLRRPDLVVMAYGTNEAGHPHIRSEPHGDHLKALIARIRTAAPDADCLVIGPMDRSAGGRMGENIAWLNARQREAAREVGCAFWSAQEAMGGIGSIRRWARERPSLAESALIHLTPRGYRRLGELLLRDVLRAYDESR